VDLGRIPLLRARNEGAPDPVGGVGEWLATVSVYGAKKVTVRLRSRSPNKTEATGHGRFGSMALIAPGKEQIAIRLFDID
jgi:hypothetical protein